MFHKKIVSQVISHGLDNMNPGNSVHTKGQYPKVIPIS